jgi:hypothetical protein
MYCENGKWIIRNFGGRRMVNPVGESRRYVIPGELVVLDRSGRVNGELPDLQIYEDPNARQKKGLAPEWLKKRPKLAKAVMSAVLVAFALGAWTVLTAITLIMLTE